MDPTKYLTAFDYGEVTQLAGATSQREYRVVAEDKEIEIAEGIKVPAWVYNGFMPGPTLRATVGDRIIIHFENRGSKPHTMHFHGIHPANMDGVFEVVPEGKTFTYDFIAEPFGVFPYHCHMISTGIGPVLRIVSLNSPGFSSTRLMLICSKRSERYLARGVGAADCESLAKVMHADPEGDHVSQDRSDDENG